VTPIARELLAPSLDTFGRSSTLPAEAYTAESVFRWELEHFFDRGWVCAGRAGGQQEDGDQRVVVWQGWLFANASGDAPPFEEHAGNLEDLIRNYGCEDLVVAVRYDYQIAANWKILVENYHECYHCSSIHPELCKVSPPRSGEDHEARGAWIGGSMELEDHAETMSLTGESFAPKLPHLTALQEREVYYYQLFPNLLLSLHPDYVMTHRLRPLAPDRTAVECEWLFSKAAVESEGFDPSYASEFWDITNGQDWEACEGVQRGASSRGYRQGPLSPEESTSGKFVATVARGYLEGGIFPVPGEALR
jgi:phenylpropionate dioxygenase-like ring-hydroxylating dioxygenase large terminal subunit